MLAAHLPLEPSHFNFVPFTTAWSLLTLFLYLYSLYAGEYVYEKLNPNPLFLKWPACQPVAHKIYMIYKEAAETPYC